MTVPTTGDGDLAPAIGSSVRVCSLGATGYPCSPLETLYTDQTLQTVQPMNPFTADSYGNITICVRSGTVYLESTYKGAVKVQPTYLVSAAVTTAPPGQTLFLSSLSLSPSSLIGPASFTGTLTLSGPAPAGGATVVVSTLNPTLVSVPPNVTVPASSTTATFTGSASQVSTSTAASIQGSYGGANQSANLTINPPAVPTPIYGGIGAPGATSSVTLSGNTVVLSTGDILVQLKTVAEQVGDVYGPFNPNNQCVYLLLFGGSHTFSDPVSGFAIPFNPPISVNVGGATMFLYQTIHILGVTTQVKVAS